MLTGLVISVISALCMFLCDSIIHYSVSRFESLCNVQSAESTGLSIAVSFNSLIICYGDDCIHEVNPYENVTREICLFTSGNKSWLFSQNFNMSK